MEKSGDTDNGRAERGAGSGVLYVFPSSHNAVCTLVEDHDLRWAPTKKIDRKNPGDDDGAIDVVDDAKVSPGATIVHFLTSDNLNEEDADAVSGLWCVNDQFDMKSNKRRHTTIQRVFLGTSVLRTLNSTPVSGEFTALLDRHRKALAGHIVCVTGMNRLEKMVAELMCASLGGNFSGNFTRDVTVLVGEQCGTAKHKAALQFKTPFVTFDWLKSTFQRSKLASFDRYAVKPLNRFEICVTAIDFESRTRIESMVSANGGTYSGSLSRNCTHLLAEDGAGSYQKLHFARSYQIPILRPQWIVDRISENGCVSDGDYVHVASTLDDDAFNEQFNPNFKPPPKAKSKESSPRDARDPVSDQSSSSRKPSKSETVSDTSETVGEVAKPSSVIDRQSPGTGKPTSASSSSSSNASRRHADSDDRKSKASPSPSKSSNGLADESKSPTGVACHRPAHDANPTPTASRSRRLSDTDCGGGQLQRTDAAAAAAGTSSSSSSSSSSRSLSRSSRRSRSSFGADYGEDRPLRPLKPPPGVRPPPRAATDSSDGFAAFRTSSSSLDTPRRNDEDDAERLLHEDEPDKIVYDVDNDRYLETCTICLLGFKQGSTVERKAIAIIRAGGGTRFSRFRERATHFVLPSRAAMRSYAGLHPGSSIVLRIQWLYECYRTRSKVDWVPYLLVHSPGGRSSSSGGHMQSSRVTAFSGPARTTSTPAAANTPSAFRYQMPNTPAHLHQQQQQRKKRRAPATTFVAGFLSRSTTPTSASTLSSTVPETAFGVPSSAAGDFKSPLPPASRAAGSGASAAGGSKSPLPEGSSDFGPFLADIERERKSSASSHGRLFSGKKFYCGFISDDRVRQDAEKRLVDAHGAQVIFEWSLSAASRDRSHTPTCDYILADEAHQDVLASFHTSLCSRRSLSPRAPAAATPTTPPFVTLFWFESCCEQRKVLAPLSNAAFLTRPVIPVGAAAVGVKGVSESARRKTKVSQTGFVHEEREAVAKLCKSLGIKCTSSFSPKHAFLVCKAPRGEKYESALKWKIPVVNSRWIYDCAARRELLPVDAYTVLQESEPPQEEQPAPAPRVERPARKAEAPPPPQQAAESAGVGGGQQPPPKRPKPRSSLGGYFAETLAVVLQSKSKTSAGANGGFGTGTAAANGGTSLYSAVNGQSESGTALGHPDENKHDEVHHMSDDEEAAAAADRQAIPSTNKRSRVDANSAPLEPEAVPKKRQRVGFEAADSPPPPTRNRGCSSSITLSPPSAFSAAQHLDTAPAAATASTSSKAKPSRKRKSSEPAAASPAAEDDIKDAQDDEDSASRAKRQRVSSNSGKDDLSELQASSKKSPQPVLKKSLAVDDDANSSGKRRKLSSSSRDAKPSGTDEAAADRCQDENLDPQTAKAASSRARAVDINGSDHADDGSKSGGKGGPGGQKVLTDDEKKADVAASGEEKTVSNTETSASNDSRVAPSPKDKAPSTKRGSKARKSSADDVEDDDSAPKFSSVEHVRVVFSGCSPKVKSALEKIVRSLGGSILKDIDTLAPTASAKRCTHLVCGSLSRTAKVLKAVLCRDMWVLDPSYLEASAEHGKFLCESSHVRSFTRAGYCPLPTSSSTGKRAKTSQKQRDVWDTVLSAKQGLSDAKSTIFEGFSSCLLYNIPSSDVFEQLLTVGGAASVHTELNADIAKSVTHCFVSNPEDADTLRSELAQLLEPPTSKGRRGRRSKRSTSSSPSLDRVAFVLKEFITERIFQHAVTVNDFLPE